MVWGASLVIIACGYLLACLVGASIAAVLIYASGRGDLDLAQLPGLVAAIFPAVSITAFPGYVILRLILSLFRRHDWPSFTVAGILNSMCASALVFQTDPFEIVVLIGEITLSFLSGQNLHFLVIGTVTATTYWRAERVAAKARKHLAA